VPCCLAIVALISPRLALVLILLFTNLIQQAFSPWWYSIIGWLFLPWTTLAWTVCYQPVFGVSGFGWFIVILGFMLDITSWATSRTLNNRTA